jgi:hypothetical protein
MYRSLICRVMRWLFRAHNDSGGYFRHFKEYDSIDVFLGVRRGDNDGI